MLPSARWKAAAVALLVGFGTCSVIGEVSAVATSSGDWWSELVATVVGALATVLAFRELVRRQAASGRGEAGVAAVDGDQRGPSTSPSSTGPVVAGFALFGALVVGGGCAYYAAMANSPGDPERTSMVIEAFVGSAVFGAVLGGIFGLVFAGLASGLELIARRGRR